MGEPRGVVNEVPDRLRAFAKGQRANQTRAETLFWNGVRAGRLDGLKFKRQVPITPFIVDFLCPAAKIVVELDGPPHDEPERRTLDAERDRWLVEQGFHVLRFTNGDMLGNGDRVLRAVRDACRARLNPSPAPLRGAPSPAEGERVGVAGPFA